MLGKESFRTLAIVDFSLFFSTSQATKDLENYDAAHHEEFKRYEMMKEHERREYLKSLDEEKRREEEARFEELRKKHMEHPKVNVPVRDPLSFLMTSG